MNLYLSVPFFMKNSFSFDVEIRCVDRKEVQLRARYQRVTSSLITNARDRLEDKSPPLLRISREAKAPRVSPG